MVQVDHVAVDSYDSLASKAMFHLAFSMLFCTHAMSAVCDDPIKLEVWVEGYLNLRIRKRLYYGQCTQVDKNAQLEIKSIIVLLELVYACI